jgi:photosystem II stability/assembly factor-like uncharacterized protein
MLPIILAVSPAAPSEVYGAAFNGGVPGPCTGGNRGLFKSPDGGSHWIPLDILYLARGIALDPVDSQVLYVLDYNQRLVKSTDGGATFQLLTAAPVGNFSTLAIDPGDPSHLYGGASGYPDTLGAVYSSPDAGATWQQVGSGFDGNVFNLALDPSTPGRLWASTEHGVFVFDP